MCECNDGCDRMTPEDYAAAYNSASPAVRAFMKAEAEAELRDIERRMKMWEFLASGKDIRIKWQ